MGFLGKTKEIVKAIVDRIQPKTIIQANVSKLAPSEMLQGRCALITGGTSGIGYAIADAFINAGASVCITGRDSKRCEKAVEQLELKKGTGTRVTYAVMDMQDVISFEPVFNSIVSKMGIIDILVNNAGTSGFGDTLEEKFDSVMSVNLKGTYFLSKVVAQYMRDKHICGNILNIASASSLRPGDSPYILSKHGIKALTVGMAKCLIKDGIIVNAIAPGPTATPMLHVSNDDIYLPNNPLGRYATKEEVASMAVILTSSLGNTIVGDVVYMTGGAGVTTVDDVKYSF